MSNSLLSEPLLSDLMKSRRFFVSSAKNNNDHFGPKVQPSSTDLSMHQNVWHIVDKFGETRSSTRGSVGPCRTGRWQIRFGTYNCRSYGGAHGDYCKDVSTGEFLATYSQFNAGTMMIKV